MINKFTYNFKSVGPLTIVADDNFIKKIKFGTLNDDIKNFESPLIKLAKQQLDEYFAGSRKIFELPLNADGTPFQKSVWQQLSEIPYGKTCSYQDIAVNINNPKAVRAVGMANNRNPIAIVVPCHRCIGKSGGLTGYAGGLALKEKLLKLESYK